MEYLLFQSYSTCRFKDIYIALGMMKMLSGSAEGSCGECIG